MPADAAPSPSKMKSARNNSHASSACVSCRAKKAKCEGGPPTCAACIQHGRECEWTVDKDRRTANGRACQECPAHLEEIVRLLAKVAELEAQLSKQAAEKPGNGPILDAYPESLPCSPGSLLPLVSTSTAQPLFERPEVGHVGVGANLNFNFGPPALGSWDAPTPVWPLEQSFYPLQNFPNTQFAHVDPPLYTGSADAAYAQFEAAYLVDEP